MEFRFLNQDDSEIIKSIVKNFRNQTISDEKAMSFLMDPTTITIACIENNQAVGYTMGYRLKRMDNGNDILNIYHLFVLEKYRRLGIARKLMEMFLDYAKRENIHYAYLLTGTDFKAARNLYESLGGYDDPSIKETYYWYITGKPQP